MKFSIKEGIPQRLVAFELNDVEWVNGTTKPDAFIGFVESASNSLDDLVPRSSRLKDAGRPYRAVMLEFSEHKLTNRTREELKVARADLGRRLAEAGFSVNTNFKNVHQIYVVSLRSNPLTGDNRPSVYVGQTCNPIDERISQHIAGKKHAVTWRLMTTRRQDLKPGDAYLSHSIYNAEVLESAWARELETRGFRAFGPNGFSTKKRLRASLS